MTVWQHRLCINVKFLRKKKKREIPNEKEKKEKRTKQIDHIYSYCLVHYARLSTIDSMKTPSFPLQTACQYFFETFSAVIIITRFGQKNDVFVTRVSELTAFVINYLLGPTSSECITRWPMSELTTINVLSLKKWRVIKALRSAYW